MNIIMVRHGEINSNKRKVYSGRSSERLNSEGILQAYQLRESLLSKRITKIYHSPLVRTKQTADIINVGRNIPMYSEESFNELIMGPWEGLSESLVKLRFSSDYEKWQLTPDQLNLNGRETLKCLLDRVLTGIYALKNQSDTQEVACIVTHVAIIRVLMLYVSGQPLSLYKSIDVPNCSIFSCEI